METRANHDMTDCLQLGPVNVARRVVRFCGVPVAIRWWETEIAHDGTRKKVLRYEVLYGLIVTSGRPARSSFSNTCRALAMLSGAR